MTSGESVGTRYESEEDSFDEWSDDDVSPDEFVSYEACTYSYDTIRECHEYSQSLFCLCRLFEYVPRPPLLIDSQEGKPEVCATISGVGVQTRVSNPGKLS